MADLERIKPPIPTLPTPVGRGIGSRRRAPDRKPPREPDTDADADGAEPRKPESDHIDEYV